MVEKKEKFSIYFLQEVHSTRETEICWQSEWGYPTIFTNSCSSRAGDGVLFNNNFHFQILKYFVDPEGTFIIADIKIHGKTLTLVNTYAPNKDEPTFFKMSVKKLFSFDCDFIIFGGACNLVCGKRAAFPILIQNREMIEVEILKKNLELIGICRVLNPDATRFTWRRKKTEIQCRLDFFPYEQHPLPSY